MTKRKSTGKKTRFEVFKRDKFTCAKTSSSFTRFRESVYSAIDQHKDADL